jgi:DNA-binding NtrC family response regulator
LRFLPAMAAPPVTPPAPLPTPPRPTPGFHGAVTEFKRRLIEATLFQLGGNRTRTARALGLQRTYLLRLMREFGVNVPRRDVPPRRAGTDDGGRPKDVDTRRAPVRQ